MTLVAAILIMTFMTTQAMLGSQRTLYEAGDLDLLLSAPLPPRRVLGAKLCGIAASVVLSFAFLVLPIALPIAVQGHPGLFGIPALLVAMALSAACLGLAVMLGVAAIAGPRGAPDRGPRKSFGDRPDRGGQDRDPGRAGRRALAPPGH